MPNGIAYQNKDIASKVFAENFKDKSLAVYGLSLPKIVQALPTNLPEVKANELRIDNLFLLEDGRIAIIDYESEYRKANKLKYLGYAYRVLERYFKEGKPSTKLVMVVIYTADVTPGQTEDSFDAGMVTLSIEPAYLSQLNSEEIKSRLDKKVRAEDTLTDAEIMEFIILPLTYQKAQQEAAIEAAINMAKRIKDEETMAFVLSGLLVFSDKIIDDELSIKTKEWIRMTKVGRLFAEEAEMERARQLVSIIESFAKSENGTIDDTCKKAGITKTEYDRAKKLLQSEEVYA